MMRRTTKMKMKMNEDDEDDEPPDTEVKNQRTPPTYG